MNTTCDKQTDRQTDQATDGHTTTAYTALDSIIASRGKSRLYYTGNVIDGRVGGELDGGKALLVVVVVVSGDRHDEDLTTSAVVPWRPRQPH